MRCACVVAALSLTGAAACGGTMPTTATATVVARDAASAPSEAETEAAQKAADAERLAAVDFAINQLDEASQLCWASASAVDGFELAGAMHFRVDIEAAATTVAVLEDDTKNARLRDCMVQLLTAFRWAPPLYGQSIELPFAFRAPVRQSVIDRRLVPFRSVGAEGRAPAVAVLLDERNAGNSAASMFALQLPSGVSTGARLAARSELWYFLAPGVVRSGKQQLTVAAGDVVWVPANSVRDVQASAASAAVLLTMPGGVEGSARAGALATPLVTADAANSGKLVKFAALQAKALPTPTGTATIVADGKALPAAVTLLQFRAGASVPPHHHDRESEWLYVLAGRAHVTIEGITLAVDANSVVQIPAGIEHSAVISEDFRAVQFYTPGGPEQRFKALATP